jgi:flavodoxin
MRTLVVYESMYGNTHVIASNIEDGLAPAAGAIARATKKKRPAARPGRLAAPL